MKIKNQTKIFKKGKMKIINLIISKIKEYSILIILVFIVVFFINNYIKGKVSEKLSNKITALNVKNDLLAKDNKEIAKQLILKDNALLRSNHKVDSIDKLRIAANKWAEYWKKEHDKIADSINNISHDDSYVFLLSVYAFQGSLDYSFNGLQVHAIHQTYLENRNKGIQLEAKETAYIECTEELKAKDESLKITEEKFELKSIQYNNAEKIIDNKDSEIEIKDKQLKRKVFWGTVKTIGIGAAFVLGLLI